MMTTPKTTSRAAAGKAASAAKKPAKKSAPKRSRKSGLTEAAFRTIALGFPGALEKPSYGEPAIFILKKFFSRLRRQDNSLVLFVGSIDERDMLIEAEPAIFHITEHYRNYPTVLARLDRIDADTLKAMLTRRWQEIAPKKLQKESGRA
jgi:hypothetical protein